MKTAGLIFILFCLQLFSVDAAEPTQGDYVKFGDYLVGTWEWEAGSIAGTITFSKSPTKSCVTSVATLGGKPLMHAMEGYDAEKRGWRRMLYWTQGGHALAITHIDKAPEAESLTGLTLRGTVRDVDLSGNALDSVVTYTVKGPDEWEVQRAEGKIVYKRQKKSDSTK